nr:MAG TPA: hypothetical protein [Caudoviricetes sp.]
MPLQKSPFALPETASLKRVPEYQENTISVLGMMEIAILRTSLVPAPDTRTVSWPSKANLPSSPVGVVTPAAVEPPNQTAKLVVLPSKSASFL